METAIDENNYENYVPSFLKNSIASEIDKVTHNWEKSAVGRGCCIAANTRKYTADPEEGCRNNSSIIEMEIVNLILHYINLKINACFDALDHIKVILCSHN